MMTTRGNSHGCRLSEADYNRISNQTIDRLCEYFERLGDENDISGFDCECANGVLTLRLGSKGTYVMNRQPPNKQIWLSSPVSGPKRYDYVKSSSRWLYEREKESLEELLSTELSNLLGLEISIPKK